MENALCKRQDGEGHPQQVQCLHRSHNHGHDNGDHHHDEGLVKCIGKRRDWRGGWSKPLGSNTFPHAETTETFPSINIIIAITIAVIISNNKLLSFLMFICVMTVVMFGVIKSGIRRTDKELVLTCSGVNFKISLVSHSQFVQPSTAEVFAK